MRPTWDPFSPNGSVAYVFEQSARMLASRRDATAAASRLLPLPPSLAWNCLGVAFPPSGWHFEAPFMRRVLMPMLLSGDEQQQTAERAVLLHDHELYERRVDAAEPALRALARDGYVRIDSRWGFAQALGADVLGAVRQRLDSASKDPRRHTVLRGQDVPELDALHRAAIPALTLLARAYLGED